MPMLNNFQEGYMKNLLMLLIFLTAISVAAQENQKYGTYYYQKKSLFELLPNDENEIIFLGNSITDGSEWAELFRDPRIKNRGISADITDGVLERLDEVTESHPLQIFLMIGINDLSRGQSVQLILENYHKIINKIQRDSEDTQILIQSILPVNDNFAKFENHVNKSDLVIELNTKLKNICQEYGVIYIDLYSQFTDDNGKLDVKYTNDGLHLTGPGYLLWKSIIEDFIHD
jgi:lysophospholipase L1-like esterase